MLLISTNKNEVNSIKTILIKINSKTITNLLESKGKSGVIL